MLPINKKSNAGFVLLEALLAIVIFAIIATGLVTIILRALNINLLASEQVVATQYASEGLEAVRSIADQAYSISYSSNKATVGHNQTPSSPGTEISSGAYTAISALDYNRYGYRDANHSNAPEEMYRYLVNNPADLSSITNLTFSHTGYVRTGDETEVIKADNATGEATVTVPSRDGLTGGTFTIGMGDSAQTVQNNLQAIPAIGTGNASVTASVTNLPMNMPYFIAITSDGNTAYVENYGNNTVTKIANLTGTPIYTSIIGGGMDEPYGISLTSDNNTAYVANWANNSITRITGLATATPTLTNFSGGNMNEPSDIALSPDNTTLYVTNFGNNSVTVVSNANTTPTYINLTGGTMNEPDYIVLTSNGNTAYITNNGNNSVTKIANLTGTPALTNMTGGAMSGPWSLALTADNSTAYIANYANSSLTKISNLSGTPTYSSLSGGGMVGSSYVVLSSDGNTAYVNNQDNSSVTRITNLNTHPVYTNLQGGSMDEPDAIVISPDNSTVYVANIKNNSLARIANAGTSPVYTNLLDPGLFDTYNVDFNGALSGASISPMTTTSPGWTVTRTTPADSRQVYVWNFQAGSFQALGAPDPATGADDTDSNTVTINSTNYTNYLDSNGYVYFKVVGATAGATLYTNQAILNLTYTGLTGAPQTTKVTGLSTATGVWTFGGLNNQLNGYTRTITISPVERDASGNIVATGGTTDPKTQKVTAHVSWSPGGTRQDSLDLTTYLTNWFTPVPNH